MELTCTNKYEKDIKINFGVNAAIPLISESNFFFTEMRVIVSTT